MKGLMRMCIKGAWLRAHVEELAFLRSLYLRCARLLFSCRALRLLSALSARSNISVDVLPQQ